MGVCGCVERPEGTGQTPRVILASGLLNANTPRRSSGAPRSSCSPRYGFKSSVHSPASNRNLIPASIAEIVEGESDDEDSNAVVPIKRADGSAPAQEHHLARKAAHADENQGVSMDVLNDRVKPSPTSPMSILVASTASSQAEQRVLADISNTRESKETSEPHPSIGSAQHSDGLCKRCCFFPRGRCTNGLSCEFCHYEHEKRTHRKRKGKNGRAPPDVEISDEAVDEVAKETEPDIPWTPESGEFPVALGSALQAAVAPPLLSTAPVCNPPIQTNAVPVFSPLAVLREERKITQAHPINDHAASNTRQWTHNSHTTWKDSRRQQPDHWMPINPQRTHADVYSERSMVSDVLHLWHDARDLQWQPLGTSWPPRSGQWDAPQCYEQQTWEWTPVPHCYCGTDIGATQAPWIELSSTEFAASVPHASIGSATHTSSTWNAAQQGERCPPLPPTDISRRNDSRASSQMPACMPVVQQGMAATDDIEISQLAPSNAQFKVAALPPGVEVAVDVDPPPFALATPEQ